MSDSKDYFSFEARQARRARRLASFDGISGIGEDRGGRITTQNAGLYAVQMAREVLDNFLLPNMPKLSYSGLRNAKVAKSNSKLEDGVITVFAEMKTQSGVICGFDIPMEIRAGELMEPSVIVVAGSPRILAQSSFDEMVSRGTIWEQPPVREIFSAPLSSASAKDQYSNRHKQKRVSPGMFSLGANRQALKDAIAGRSITAQVKSEPVGPDEQAMNTRINDLSHKLDFGLGNKSKNMLELQRLVQDRQNLRKRLGPGMSPSVGQHEAQNRIPSSPITQSIPKLKSRPNRPSPQRDPGADEETQTMRSEDWDVLQKKMNPPSSVPDMGTVTDRPAVDHGNTKTVMSPTPDQPTQQALPPSARNTQPGAGGRPNTMNMPTQLRMPADMPTQSGQPAGTPATKSQRPVKRMTGAVEDYDADDRHERPDVDRNQQDEDHLDPAERSTNDLHAGQKATIKEALELKDRGGAVYDISKGSKCTIVRDLAGDNKAFVIRMDDGMEAIVERRFLAKSASQRSASMTELIDVGVTLDHPLADVKNAWLAGGAVKDLMRGVAPKDYDYFFADKETYTKCANRFMADGGEIVGNNNMAMQIRHDGNLYELVHGRMFPTLKEALDSFDLTACMFGTIGNKVVATRIGLDDFNARVIRPWSVWNIGITHTRVAKWIGVQKFRDPFNVLSQLKKMAYKAGIVLAQTPLGHVPTPWEIAHGITPQNIASAIQGQAARAQIKFPGVVSGVMPDGSIAGDDVYDDPNEGMFDGPAWPESRIFEWMRAQKYEHKNPADIAVEQAILNGCSGTPTPAPDEVKYLHSIYKSAGARSAQYIPAPEDGMPTVQKQKQEMDNEPVSLVADMEFMGKIDQELNAMREQGISEIDQKGALTHKYGPAVAQAAFEKTAP